MRVRNGLYDRGWKKVHAAAVPVISVGNLTVGGTGKTPTVVLLARWFRNRDVRVAILSRGYGAGADGRNDEARELETKLDDVPHLQDPDRVSSSQIAVEELDMQVLLLDDGFQHRRMARQLDIVLLDATNPFGYDHWLPRGLLRESPRSLRRAQIVLLTRCDLVTTQRLAEIRARVQKFAPNAAWVETEHRPLMLKNASGQQAPIQHLSGKRGFAFCGIGNPEAFYDTIRRSGVELVGNQTFPDHYEFKAEDLASLSKTIDSLPTVDMVLCTGKDLAKLHIDQLGSNPLFAVDIELTIRLGREAFEERLEEIQRAIDQSKNVD
jgi:tetraacyldisaccharide 4'-kinase